MQHAELMLERQSNLASNQQNYALGSANRLYPLENFSQMNAENHNNVSSNFALLYHTKDNRTVNQAQS